MAIDNNPLSTTGGDVALENGNGAPMVPKKCKAGVVQENGPNFRIVVEEVDVPEPGKSISQRHRESLLSLSSTDIVSQRS